MRVVQVSLLALAVFLGDLAWRSWEQYNAAVPAAGVDDVAGPAVMALICAGGVLWMGLRTVRGPVPPSLD